MFYNLSQSAPSELLGALQSIDEHGIRLDVARSMSEVSDTSLYYGTEQPTKTTSSTLTNSYVKIGIGNLVNKFMSTLLPTPMFVLDEDISNFIREQAGLDEKVNVSEFLSDAIYHTNKHIVPNIMEQLILCGNCLEVTNRALDVSNYSDSYTTKSVIPIMDYGVKRNARGKVIALAYRRHIDYTDVPKGFVVGDNANSVVEKIVETHAYWLTDKGWAHRLEIEGTIQDMEVVADGQEPFTVLTWEKPKQTNYSTGLLEFHRALLDEYSITNIKTVKVLDLIGKKMLFVKGTILPNLLNKLKKNKWLIPFSPFGTSTSKPVEAVNRVDAQDISMVLDTKSVVKQELADIFLMVSGAIRPSERTTLGEVQQTVSELYQRYQEQYLWLIDTWQKPLLQKILTEEVLGERYREFYDSVDTSVDTSRKAQRLDKINKVLEYLGIITKMYAELNQTGFTFDMRHLIQRIKEEAGADIQFAIEPVQQQEQQAPQAPQQQQLPQQQQPQQ